MCVVHPKRNDAAAEREKKIAGNNGYNGLNGSFVNCELLQEKRTYNNKKRFIEKETEERRPKKWTQLHWIAFYLSDSEHRFFEYDGQFKNKVDAGGKKSAQWLVDHLSCTYSLKLNWITAQFK